MNYAEAKQKVIDSGYQGIPTPEIIKQFGWTIPDPLAGFDPAAPILDESQLKDNLAILLEEAKANNVTAEILAAIGKFGGLAITALTAA